MPHAWDQFIEFNDNGEMIIKDSSLAQEMRDSFKDNAYLRIVNNTTTSFPVGDDCGPVILACPVPPPPIDSGCENLLIKLSNNWSEFKNAKEIKYFINYEWKELK